MSQEVIRIHHLSKTFGKNVVLRDIDFSVSRRRDVHHRRLRLRKIHSAAVPEPSGDAHHGEVLYHGQDIIKSGINEAAYRAKVGMVFQSFNLLTI